jgi:phenylacetate-coenzyme A ligase PaaK-like adenylate-forming protein
MQAQIDEAKGLLDDHVRRMVEHHFSPETGTPYWLYWAKQAGWSPVQTITGFDDLAKLGPFDLAELRDAEHHSWVPKTLIGRPFSVFETGGTTGFPTQRLSWSDHIEDYTSFSHTLSNEDFPQGASWLIVGPTGPRRLRISMEHLAQHRGGHAYFVDLDPRWVRKRLAEGDTDAARQYQEHVVDQAVTILSRRSVQCMFTTPRLLEAIGERISLADVGMKGVLCGGTSMRPQEVRFMMEEVLEGQVAFAPVYGNTLMGVAPSLPVGPHNGYSVHYYPPMPRAVIRVLGEDGEPVEYGVRGRVELTTMTSEFFMPRVLERDSAVRCPPCEQYPWDGVADVQPIQQAGRSVNEGVY